MDVAGGRGGGEVENVGMSEQDPGEEEVGEGYET